MFLENLVHAITKAKIKYCLVGGYAVAMHGAVRGTVNIDLVININETSLSKMQTALQSLGLLNHLPITPKDIATYRDEYIKNKNLIAWNFTNPNNPGEAVDIIIPYDFDDMETVTKMVGRLSVTVVSIKDLIRMKKRAGRQQDLIDIKALEKLL